MSKQTMKATIDANIKQNGVQAITGPVLNSVLNQMVDNYADQGETSLKLTKLEGKINNIGDANSNKIETKVNALILCVADLITKVVFHGGIPFPIPSDLQSLLNLERYNEDAPKAICGLCLCGEVLCGQV